MRRPCRRLPDLEDEVRGPGVLCRGGGAWRVAEHADGQRLSQHIPERAAGHELGDDGALGGLEAGAQEEADVGVAQAREHGHLGLELSQQGDLSLLRLRLRRACRVG